MAKSYEEMVAEAKGTTEQVSVEDVHGVLSSGENVTILDVREKAEWDDGHIGGAVFIPRGLLEVQAAQRLPDREARIFVHCALGGRGALAAKTLKEMGYTKVANMDGGFKTWRERGYEVE